MLKLARFLLIPLCLLACIGVAIALFSSPASTPEALNGLTDRPLVIAHRGGRGLWPENTQFAFQRASDLGVDVLEMDVHRSRDGHLVVIHDRRVDRTTDGQGRIRDLDLSQLQALDAGYRWTADGGQSFPYRGQGIRIPTLDEVLKAHPRQTKVIEIKVPDADLETQLCQQLQAQGQTKRVIVGSFYERSLQRFREVCPQVATSAGPSSVKLLVVLNWLGLSDLLSPGYEALQVPEEHEGLPIASADLIANARKRGLHVQLWTINEQADMQRLLAMGAQGLITDYPDRALQLLGRQTALARQDD